MVKVMADDASMVYIQEPSKAQQRRRPTRACTARTAARLAPLAPAPPPRNAFPKKKPGEYEPPVQLAPVIPSSAHNERWKLRNMWQLASVLNFFSTFRPLLGFEYDFTADDLETALLVPNSRLDDIHLALLKAIPPPARIALTRDTWVTVLCKKLKDWWRKVADGPCPIVANHGLEIDIYKNFDPATRVIILKALCEIRFDQDDMRNYVEESLKHGYDVSTFRKESLGDIYGTTYWYENDTVLGHRLYRELLLQPPQTEAKAKSKGAMKGRAVPPPVSGHWEMVATNFEEFQDVVEKLCASKNKLEASLGRKINTEILPEIEEAHKKKERALKKQARQAMLLESCMSANGLASGRSRRDRKPVTYTFDAYDKSISEAIKFTKKKQLSPEPPSTRRDLRNADVRTNGTAVKSDYVQRLRGFSSGHDGAEAAEVVEAAEADYSLGTSLRSGRQPRRPQKYPDSEYVEEIDGEPSSDDEIVGEVVFDEEYLLKKKRKKEEDEEYRGDEDEFDADEGANHDSDYVYSEDESSGNQGRYWQRPGRPQRTRDRGHSTGEESIPWDLRRSNRATRRNTGYEEYDSEFEEADEDAEDRVGRDNAHMDVNDEEPEDSGAGEDEESREQSEGSEESEDEDDHLACTNYEGQVKSARPNGHGVQQNKFSAGPLSLKQPDLLDLNQEALNGYSVDVPGAGSSKLRLRIGAPKSETVESDVQSSDSDDGDRTDHVDTGNGLENGTGTSGP